MIFPSPFRLALAIWRLALAAICRRPLMVTPEVQTERKRECMACPHFDAIYKQCEICTCFVSVKTLFATERCPKGRWKREFYRVTR